MFFVPFFVMFTSEFNNAITECLHYICKLSYASQECCLTIKCLLSPAAGKGILGLRFGLGVDWREG